MSQAIDRLPSRTHVARNPDFLIRHDGVRFHTETSTHLPLLIGDHARSPFSTRAMGLRVMGSEEEDMGEVYERVATECL